MNVHMPQNPTNQTLRFRFMLRGISMGIALVIAFAAGFFLHPVLNTAQPSQVLADPPEGYPLLTEVDRLLRAHYVHSLPENTSLEYAAIRGMLSALNDPYTFFVDPPVAQSESDVLAGQYGGIGVQVQYAANGDFLLYPLPDSPALEAGIEDGDILLAVDDLVIEPGTSIDVIDQTMRGEVGDGNGVTLRVQKRDGGDEQTYSIAFAEIYVPSVVWRTLVEDDRLGYLQILNFTSRTPDELREALAALEALELNGWVLDLRDNAGGLLQEAIQVADEFLDGGVIVYEQTRDEERQYDAAPGGAGLDVPMVILVNHGTASAAELVAGALRDNDRGVLLGQATYGKGSVQLIFPLADGSSVHITSAEWYTPARTPLERNGLEPDIPMIPAENSRDVELDEAIRYLQQQHIS